MDDSIPSISSGAVGSRFVSQSELDTAKARRDEQWKAAYARFVAEAPPTHTRPNLFCPAGSAKNHRLSNKKMLCTMAAVSQK